MSIVCRSRWAMWEMARALLGLRVGQVFDQGSGETKAQDSRDGGRFEPL
jgi:hypothetical protein